MRIPFGTYMVAVFSLLAAWSCTGGQDQPRDIHWGYEGEGAPAHWAALSAEYATCGSGAAQSPIDIVLTEDVDLPPLALQYAGRVTAAVNNGHAVQLDVEPGNHLDVAGRQWTLAQVHFHAPSEHRVNGEPFPLEAHFVHRDDAGNLAVLSRLFREGDAHPALDAIGAPLPARGDAPRPLAVPLSMLLPADADLAHYRYDGSLTTPPCTEGVQWYVLRTVEMLSPEQLAAFTRAAGPNARGVQPLNGRRVLQ